MNLNIKIKFLNEEISLLDALAFLAIIVVGLVLRITLFDFMSGDYTEFLEKWTRMLSEYGFASLKDPWYNYTPLYMYVLYVIAKLPISNLYGIKIFSILFDLFLSMAVAKATMEIRNKVNPLIPFAIVWFLPTVVSNSAMWGQCDAIYTFFIVMTFIYLLKGNSFKSMLFFAFSFAIKLQSVFFAPVILLLFFLKKIRFRDFFLVPITYFISIIPLWIAGRPLKSCLLIYLEQSRGKSSFLSSNYPNIYYLIMNDAFVELYQTPAIIFTVAVLLVLMYFVLKTCYSKGINKIVILETVLACGSIIVFLLPNMRERYSYMVDIISVIYALTVPKKYHIPILRIGISYLAYTTFYVHGMFTSYEILAVIGIYLIYDSVSTLLKTLREMPETAKDAS